MTAGVKYHRLTYEGTEDSLREKKIATFRCDCGREIELPVQVVMRGRRKTCGCKRIIHGASRTTMEYTWKSMKDRCQNPKAKEYSYYGGRGIFVCERWQSLANFVSDMGPHPGKQYTLDRIDNNGPYSPENCRWATRREQMLNRRNTQMVTAFGQTKPLYTWAEEFKLAPSVIKMRLKRGWPPEIAIKEPLLYLKKDEEFE